MSGELLPGIPEDAVEEHFVRAPGPGGQHVNKASTAVQLRVRLGRTTLTEPVKARLRALAGHRLTRQDEIVLTAHRYRSQHRNREDALARLAELLREASTRQARRIATKPGAAARKRRLDDKKHRGATKQGRRKPNLD